MALGIPLAALAAILCLALPAEAAPRLCGGASKKLPHYDFGPLAQSLKSEKLARGSDLGRKLKQTDVCGNKSTAQDQLCAIAVYLHEDELHEDEKGPRAMIGPVLALVINELPSASNLPAYTFSSAKQAITTDAQGFVRQLFFEEIARTRVATEIRCDGAPIEGPAKRDYVFITVIGWQENREKKLGIPAEYFDLKNWMSN